MKISEKEHYEILKQFEMTYKYKNLKREEDKELWKRGRIYQDGNVNDLFLAFRNGYCFRDSCN